MKRLATSFEQQASSVVGRDAEIRTRDLTHPKGARYQAAPHPVKTHGKYLWKRLFVKSAGLAAAEGLTSRVNEQVNLSAARAGQVVVDIEQRQQVTQVLP